VEPALQEQITQARGLVDPDPLVWRRRVEKALPHLGGHELRLVLQQAELANRAERSWGSVAPTAWLLTRDGLEQGTHPRVADLRAAHIAATGATRVIDLTAGLGFDTAACLRAGLEVISVERDEQIAAYCEANNPRATVVCTTAEEFLSKHSLEDTDVLLVDPARRSTTRNAQGTRALPERDPQQWSPPMHEVEQWATHAAVALKAAPSFAGLPHGSVQWVALHRTIVESAWYSWELPEGSQSAAIVTEHTTEEFAQCPTPLAHVDRVRENETLLEVNPAVARAHAWTDYAQLAQFSSEWLVAPAGFSHVSWGRSYRTLADSVSRSAVPALLREHSVTRAAIKTGATADDPDRLRQQWKIADDDHVVLIVLDDQVVLAERIRTPIK